MLRRRPSLIVFDLDGTLVDSAPDLAFAIDQMLIHLGQPPAGEARVRDWVGDGMAMLVKRALTGEDHPSQAPLELEQGLGLYRQFYGENLSVRSRLYPGAKACLEHLKAKGYALALVTNKDSAFTRPVLERFGILDFFDRVASGDQFERQKPDPESLHWVARELGVPFADSLMVGDSKADAEAARRGGFQSAMVAYGYHGKGPVSALGADLILESLADLPPLLDSLPC
jgi:phosphoglycolate phosphatase